VFRLLGMRLAQLVLLDWPPVVIHRAGDRCRPGPAVLYGAPRLVAAGREFDGSGFFDYRSHRCSSITAATTMQNNHKRTAIDGRTLTLITFID
jgi:hypothetical protein